MFRSKKSIYILLPLNILVWGWLGFKIYNVINDGKEVADINDMKPVEVKKNDADTLSYVLKLNYEDPFLRSQQKKQVAVSAINYNNNKAKKENKNSGVAKQTIDIKYLGVVQNTNSGATTALVSINGTSQLVKPGQIINGINFKSIDKNQIIAFVGKEKVVVVK